MRLPHRGARPSAAACAPLEAAARSALEAELVTACGCPGSHTLLLDAGGRILQSNGGPGGLLGYDAGALDGIHITHLVEDRDLTALQRLLAGGSSEPLRLRDARGRFVTCRAELVTRATSGVCAQAQHTSALRVLRLHADLTRPAHSRQQLQVALEELLLRTTVGAGVVLLDLDGFRLVNESLGWESGDDLLQELEERLATTERTGWVAAGRVGDDEFYLVMECSEDDLASEVEAALHVLGSPVSTSAASDLSLTACAGWAWGRLPQRRASRETSAAQARSLLQQADRAAGQAKRAGQGEARGGSSEAQEGGERLRLAHELRIACERPGAEGGVLEVHYQPTVELQRAGVHGLEALVRWHHPTRGLLLPGTFLALAEESDLICRIGQIVLTSACTDLAWLRSQPGCEHLRVNVNVVARQLRQVGFIEQVERCLTEAGLPPEALVLEVTEQTTVSEGTPDHLALRLLRELGVGLAIDDFGTGYSALAYLPQLPAQILKIDKQFVHRMLEHDGQARLVEAITQLGHQFGMTLVAEGVEEPAQHRMLVSMGCEVGQGYLYSRPVPRAALPEALRAAAAAAHAATPHSGPTLSE